MVEQQVGYNGTGHNSERSPFDEISNILLPLGDYLTPEQVSYLTTHFHNRFLSEVSDRSKKPNVRIKRLIISLRWSSLMALSEFLVESGLNSKKQMLKNHTARQHRVQERIIKLSENSSRILNIYPSKMADMEREINEFKDAMGQTVLPLIDTAMSKVGEGSGLFVRGTATGMGSLAKIIGFGAGYAVVTGSKVLKEFGRDLASRIEEKLARRG